MLPSINKFRIRKVDLSSPSRSTEVETKCMSWKTPQEEGHQNR